MHLQFIHIKYLKIIYSIYVCYAVMYVKKFKIPVVPPTTNKCIRFPNNIIKEVENAIKGKDCTFTAFVIEAVKVALENLEEDEINKKHESKEHN